MTQYLSFQLAGEEFAFGILRVKEILEYDTLTRVPNAPPAVRGVINLRGAVVPVLDLAHLFGLPATAVTKRSCVIIVEVRVDEQELVMGILADAVNQVIELAPDTIEPAPAFGSRASDATSKDRGELNQCVACSASSRSSAYSRRLSPQPPNRPTTRSSST